MLRQKINLKLTKFDVSVVDISDSYEESIEEPKITENKLQLHTDLQNIITNIEPMNDLSKYELSKDLFFGFTKMFYDFKKQNGYPIFKTSQPKLLSDITFPKVTSNFSITDISKFTDLKS